MCKTSILLAVLNCFTEFCLLFFFSSVKWECWQHISPWKIWLGRVDLCLACNSTFKKYLDHKEKSVSAKNCQDEKVSFKKNKMLGIQVSVILQDSKYCDACFHSTDKGVKEESGQVICLR